jgi:hypothetical protein
MADACENLCPTCQYRTVEFVISFGGPDRVTSGDICGLDLPGYPQKTTCVGFEPKRNPRVFAPSDAQYPVGFATTGGPEFEASALNG